MIQRSGEVVIRMLENVKQETIKPLILQTVTAETQLPMNILSIIGWKNGDLGIKPSIIPQVNMRVMKMAMVFARYTPTASKVFGHICDLGLGLIVVFLRLSDRYT